MFICKTESQVYTGFDCQQSTVGIADTVLMPDPKKLKLLEALFKWGLNYLSKVLGWPWFIASLALMVPVKEAKVVLLHNPGELAFFFFASYKKRYPVFPL